MSKEDPTITTCFSHGVQPGNRVILSGGVKGPESFTVWTVPAANQMVVRKTWRDWFATLWLRAVQRGKTLWLRLRVAVRSWYKLDSEDGVAVEDDDRVTFVAEGGHSSDQLGVTDDSDPGCRESPGHPSPLNPALESSDRP